MYPFSFSLSTYPFACFSLVQWFFRAIRRLSNELGPSFTPVFNLIGQVEAMFKMAQERLYVEMQNSLKTYWETHFFGHLLAAQLGPVRGWKFPRKLILSGIDLS